MLITPKSLTLAFPLLLAAVPDDADACPGYQDPCSYAEAWADLTPRNAAKIPVDGVLVLQGDYTGYSPGASADIVDLEVTLDGQPIVGAVEATPRTGVLVWRPAEPWQPGATYQLTGTVTNPVSEFECAPEQLMLAADLVIDTAPAATLTAPEVSAVATVKVNPVLDLYNFACCAGAPGPTQQDTNCGIYINFDPELCAPTQGYGSLSLEVTATPAAEGPAADQLLYTLKEGPDVYDVSPDPTAVQLDYVSRSICLFVEALDLASGDVVAGEPRCFGEDLEDQLGPRPLDPTETLSCPLFLCGDEWTPEDCTPDDPGDTPTTSAGDDGDADGSSDESGVPGLDSKDDACSCTTAPSPPAALLALALLALPRRRRLTRREARQPHVGRPAYIRMTSSIRSSPTP